MYLFMIFRLNRFMIKKDGLKNCLERQDEAMDLPGRGSGEKWNVVI